MRRALRIYPALIACLVAMYFAGTYGLPGLLQAPFSAFIPNITLQDITIHGASWTLRVEMLAAPMMLLLAAASVRLGGIALIGALIFTTLAIGDATLVGGSPWLSVSLISFVLGAMVITSQARQVFKAAPAYAWVGALIGLFLARHITQPAISGMIVLSWCAFLLVGLVYHDNAPGLSRVLQRPISAFLGRISYSFYLWNVPALQFTGWLVPTDMDYILRGALIGAISTLVTIPLAILSERFIERPFISLSHALKRTPAASLRDAVV